MSKKELFEKVWRSLYPDKESDQVDYTDVEIQKIVRRLKRTFATQEPDYDAMWKRLQAGQRRRKRVLFARYAAAIALPVFFLSTIYLWKPDTSESSLAQVDINISKTVSLILSDSSVVNLQDQQQMELIGDKDVKIKQDSEKGLTYVKGNVEDTVLHYNTLIVPTMTDYRLQLADGTVVYLNADSRLRYPVDFRGKERRVFLEGEAYFEVAKDSLHPFIVDVVSTEVRVLGTSFNVNAYPNSETVTTTLEEGKVLIVCGEEKNTLTPGMQLVHNLQTNETEVREVDTEQYTSWKDGYYVFYKETLENIMTRLSRWYGIQVLYQDNKLRELEFVGRLRRYEQMDYLLKRMEDSHNIQFEINGNVVTVKNKTD